MKKLLLSSLIAVLALSGSNASAQVFFNPDFSSGSTPAGYTATIGGTNSITYTGNQLNATDWSTSNLAYISSVSGTSPTTGIINSQITFTPSYTYTGSQGGSADLISMSLITANANNPLMSIDLDLNSYQNNAFIIINAGLQYGGGTTIGNNSYTSAGIDSLSGVALTLLDTTTMTLNGTTTDISAPAGYYTNWTITNNATLLNGSTVLYTFSTSTTGNDNGYGDYDPINNPFSIQLGIAQGSSVDYGGSDAFLAPGASVSIANSVLVAVPEPSTYALLLGGVGLVLLISRRRSKSSL